MKKTLKSLIGLLALVLLTSVVNAQTADKPYAGATYKYKVQADDLTNAITWAVYDGNTPLPISDYTITFAVDGVFSVATITWGLGLTADNTYTIKYTEEDKTTLCITVRDLDVVYKANNSFDATIAATNASDCNALNNTVSELNDEATTTVSFTVSMKKDDAWTINSWKYKFAVSLTGSGTHSVSDVRIVGIGGVTELGGKYADSGITAGVTRTIEVDVLGNANHAITVALQLSDAFAVNGLVNTAETVGGDTNDASTIIDALPAASAITIN
jgi:hypothetical protein